MKNKQMNIGERYHRNKSVGDNANRRRLIKLFQRVGGVHYKSMSVEDILNGYHILWNKKYDEFLKDNPISY